MKVPVDWLSHPISIQEVEELLAAEGAPDLWLDQWHYLVGLAGPGDELWEYFAIEVAETSSASWDSSDMQFGYALTRDGEVVDAISAASLPWA
jgi:hypothetical protein